MYSRSASHKPLCSDRSPSMTALPHHGLPYSFYHFSRVDDAFPAIVPKAQFNRVAKLMRSRAPKIVNPRRVASPFLLSGLVKCKTCRRALTGQYAKSGQFPYYVCQTLMKRGSGSCDTPRLNARRFEKLVVDKIRSNILTEDNIRDLVKTVDEKIDGVAADQHKRLEAIDAELEDVKRHLGRIWHFIGETDNVEMADAADHIRELRIRQERLEDEASAARAILTQRRSVLDDVNTIEAYAKDMRDFLKQSELTERKAFIQSFVKEIIVMPGDALLRYTVPMPSDSLIPGKAIEKMALNDPVLVSVHRSPPDWTRTKSQVLTLTLRLAQPGLSRTTDQEYLGFRNCCPTGTNTKRV